MGPRGTSDDDCGLGGIAKNAKKSMIICISHEINFVSGDFNIKKRYLDYIYDSFNHANSIETATGGPSELKSARGACPHGPLILIRHY